MANSQDIYLFKYDGPIVPKARPRHVKSSGHTYMPKNYRQWMAKTVRNFRSQAKSAGLDREISWPVRVFVLRQGKHDRSGDGIDNVPGALADALVKARVLKDDNSLKLPGAVSDLEHNAKMAPITWIAFAPHSNSFREGLSQLEEILDAIGA